MSTVATAGCDPHLDTIATAVIDPVGRHMASRTVPNSEAGWRQLAALFTSMNVAAVGVEAASGYGRALAGTLTEAGLMVVEVPTRVTARERRRDGNGKTDPGDARAVARAVAAGQGSVWVDDTDLETVRLLTHHRETLVRTQTQEINRLRALIAEIDPQRAANLGRLRSRRQLDQLTRIQYRGDSYRETTGMLIRQLASDCRRRLHHIRQTERRLRTALPPVGAALMTIDGVGLITACQLLAEIAGTGGFATPAKLAAWAGTAPLDASSGRQQHHRLNRGGNRQANRAIHTIIITQLRHGGEAARYITRRIQEGKTEKAAIRAAKRHATRRIWKTLNTHGLT